MNKNYKKGYSDGVNDAMNEFAVWLGNRLAIVHLFPEQRASLYADILNKVVEIKETNNGKNE